MANNKLDKVYLSKEQLDTIANGGTISSGEDNYTADESALYLIDDDSVSFNEQSLTTEQKAQARTNIGAGTSDFSGLYADLPDKPTIPTDNSQLTNGSNYQTDTDVSNAINTATSGMLTTSNYGETLDDVYQAKGNYASSSDVSNLTTRVGTIESKIPSQASSTNQLADKEFVNSTVSTSTATFRGTFDTLSELQATSGDLNDYAYLEVYDITEPTQVKQYDRYKHNGSGWAFEYTLNNSSFTASQWAAINSGITSNLAGKITTNENNINNLSNSKQDAITSSNKLSSDLVDDTGHTNKFVTATEKNTWNGMVSDVSYDSTNKKLQETKNGNTTDIVTFGANAFNSTTIPTNTNQLTNGAGFITASDLPTNYATVQVYNSEAEAQAASQADPNKICLY